MEKAFYKCLIYTVFSNLKHHLPKNCHKVATVLESETCKYALAGQIVMYCEP